MMLARINNASWCYSLVIILVLMLFLAATNFHKSPTAARAYKDELINTGRRLSDIMLLSRLTDSKSSEVSVRHFGTMYPKCTRQSVICHRQTTTEAESFLLRLSLHSLKFLFHSILTDLDFSCSAKKSFGEPGLGVYEACMVSNIQPKAKDCLIYSFGVSNDWSFDEAMAKFGCEVHSFDPSLGLGDHQHSSNVTFHNTGLWGSNILNAKGWAMERLSTIRKNLGHQKRVIDILKIDVEGGEWPFLRDVLYKNATQLLSVKQILVELHSPRFRSETVVERDYIEMITYMMDLKELGFKTFKNFHNGNCCEAFAGLMPPEIPERCCQEIAMVNTRFLNNEEDE